MRAAAYVDRMSLLRRSTAEFVGTFWLVFGGCGSAVLAAAFPGLGIGFAGVALAFGLTVLTMAAALGPISGGHFNPAVSIGLCAGGRFPSRDLPAYIVAQVAGGIVAGAVLYLIASGAPGFSLAGGFAANGYGAHSPGHYALPAAALCETVLTAGFLMVIMGATDPSRASAGFAPIFIGFALTLIHLISIPVTNTSVNPARSTGVALYAGSWALGQLWLFWLAPIVGGALGGLGYRALVDTRRAPIQNRRSSPKSMVGPEGHRRGAARNHRVVVAAPLSLIQAAPEAGADEPGAGPAVTAHPVAEPDGGERPGLEVEPTFDLQRQAVGQRDPQRSDDVRKADRPLAGVLVGGDRVGVLDRQVEAVAPPEAQRRRDRQAVAPEALELAADAQADRQVAEVQRGGEARLGQRARSRRRSAPAPPAPARSPASAETGSRARIAPRPGSPSCCW